MKGSKPFVPHLAAGRLQRAQQGVLRLGLRQFPLDEVAAGGELAAVEIFVGRCSCKVSPREAAMACFSQIQASTVWPNISR
jgi:hypothetical protein